MHCKLENKVFNITEVKEEFCEICGNVQTSELGAALGFPHPCVIAQLCENCDMSNVCDENCPAYEYSMKARIIEAS